jgi:uncharacterized protein (TIGR02246 family)
VARGCAVLALALALFGCGGPTFTASDREAIEGLLAAQRTAWNEGDLDGFMAGYLRDTSLSFASGGEVQRGWERTMARYRTRYPDPAAMGTLAFHIQEVRPISADAALVLGGFELTETPRAGTGVFTLLVQRRPEGWRIVHDHTSAAAPPALPAADPAPDSGPAPAPDPASDL